MKTKNTGAMVFLGLVILGLVTVTVWSIRAYQSPMGPALAGSAAATATDTPAGAQPAPVVTMTSAPALGCGENAVWNILILGSDAGDQRYIKGSDLTRMVRVDFPNKKATMYAFSRNLWVTTNDLGLTNPTINETHLGMVFYEARKRSTQAGNRATLIDGTSATARMLLQNFTIGTDHYVALDLTQLPAMVDAVGGIPINVPFRTTDPWIGMVIEAGQQTLNGAQVVAYARAIPDSDFGRINRNHLLFEALRQKLLDPAVWVNIPQLYMQYKDVIATDFSPEQINHLACLLKEVPNGAIVQEQVKPEWTSPGPVPDSLRWDKTQVLNQLMELDLIH